MQSHPEKTLNIANFIQSVYVLLSSDEDDDPSHAFNEYFSIIMTTYLRPRVSNYWPVTLRFSNRPLTSVIFNQTQC